VNFAVDSGLHSRLYDPVMAANHQGAGATLRGEVAKRTATTVDAIRFYEKRRLLSEAVRTSGHFRLYTTDDIERVRFIQQMQSLGFSLREVGEWIDLRTDKVDACEAVEELLQDKLADPRAKMRQLEELESELVADLRNCSPELQHRQRHAACGCPVLDEADQ
jgi:DNA-binding transcriptional MerR regulator